MFDLGERVGTIIKKVPRLPAVDPDHSQQQLSTETQGHGRLALTDDILYIVLKVRLQDILLCEFAIKISV